MLTFQFPREFLHMFFSTLKSDAICNMSTAITSQFKAKRTELTHPEHVQPQRMNDSTEHFTCKPIPRADAIRFVIYTCQNEQRL